MSGSRFLRVAHPLELWDGSTPADDVAQALASEAGWSLFIRLDDLDPLVVLGAFYGWRSGRGPLHDHGYLVFSAPELQLSEGRLLHSPANFTHGWPREVRDAHYDLEGHTASGAAAFVSAVGPMAERLHRVSRLDVLLAQHELRSRSDAPGEFKSRVEERLRKLRNGEPVLMEALRTTAMHRGIPIS